VCYLVRFNAGTFRNMLFITICRGVLASLSQKGSRLLRSYIFAAYGLPTPPDSVPFTFFPTRKFSFRRISPK
jgi:hypothetical protein